MYEEALPFLECSLKILERKVGPSPPYFKMDEQNIKALKAKM